MKLRKSLLLILCLAMTTAASAKQVSLSQAKQLAIAHQTQKGPHRAQGVNPASASLQLIHMEQSADNMADFYVFNNGSRDGFIIVAGDDRAVPILGYSDSGTFDPANLPDGLKCMLEIYAQEMKYLRNNPHAAQASAPQAHNAVVEPLLKSNWDQSTPFNNLCPSDEVDGKTFQCATGCVATAAAQIMYYYKWPKAGKGSNSYDWIDHGEQQIHADFNHAYDWDNMIDNYIEGHYNEQQATAVATLMFDAGVAANMNYGKSSSASAYWMMDAMRNHFSYNKGMKHVLRNTKTITEWENLIFNELNNKRPIMYSGFTPKGGHTFVLDGYNAEGYFHFNWGWSSLSNGYFVITALNPREQGVGSFDGGYNTSQSMAIDMYPQENGVEPDPYLEITCESFMPTVTSANLGDNIKVELFGFMGTGFGYGTRVDINYVFVLTDANNEIIETYDEYPLSMSMGSRYTYSVDRKNPRSITPSTALTNGDYHLRLMYKRAEEDASKYRFYDHNGLKADYVVAHVQDGTITFSKAKIGNSKLQVSQFDYPVPVGDNSFFPATLTLTNAGDEYYGDIHVAAKGPNDEDYNDMYSVLVDVPNGGELTLNCTMFPPRGFGDYQMVVRDNAGNVIDGPRTLTVAQSENYLLEAASQLTPGNYYMQPDNVNAHIDIRNSGTQSYTGCISYEIQLNGRRRCSGLSDVITIPVGETRTVNFKTQFEGQPNVEYNYHLFNIKNDTQEEKDRITARFMLADAPTGVANIAGDNVKISQSGGTVNVTGAKCVNIYSATGMLAATGNSCTLPAGIYIIVADGSVNKIAVK